MPHVLIMNHESLVMLWSTVLRLLAEGTIDQRSEQAPSSYAPLKLNVAKGAVRERALQVRVSAVCLNLVLSLVRDAAE